MIPRQPRGISFYDEFVQTVPRKIITRMQAINSTFLLVIFILYNVYDIKAENILNEENAHGNKTDLNGKYGYDSGLFVSYISLFIFSVDICAVLCKRVYRILSLWIVYQYQYKKGLFLAWLEKRKEKLMQQNKIVINNKNIKEDATDNIKTVVVE
ncbi:10693_t:CDS:2 [Dentiscutata heterogama]|uniref:10693_t:CDS:1 n=1 Tax=Dentiscutata heterogama TaxID=1316150 RepID=A0ACA9PKL3_9GLOM|nr:10693_t:CDS:2 [Dentiscutata heterogama]